MSFLSLVKLWLWVSVLATVAGWTLSAFRALNKTGYAIFFCVAAVLIWFGRNRLHVFPSNQEKGWKRLMRRFRQPLPLAFAVLCLLVLLGGLLYAPTNHTALTYRFPRVLQWLEHGHWFWIHTLNYRMNDRACGIEWLSAPLLLFTKSDRGLFLLNFIPFLLLPGLIFSLFTRAGVLPKVAWQWMWLLPTGYTFLLQAGSAGNDTFPTVYALAAVDFACRGWFSRRPSDLWYSILAAALLTGAKASNLPLLLPWFVALVPLFIGGKTDTKKAGISSQRPMTVAVIFLGLLASFLPTAILNIHYCHDWSGLALERTGMDMKNPFVGVWGNAFLFLLDNLVPPFFPAASWWNANALNVLPRAVVTPLVANFESSFHWLWELPTEDWVGLGFGVSWLAFIAAIAGRKAPSRGSPDSARRNVMTLSIRRGICLGGWLALLAYCVKSGMATGARLISPYYPFLLPLLLTGANQGEIVRRRWWKICVWFVVILSIPVLLLAPARPLWPACTILSSLDNRYPGHKLISRALKVYSIYSTRADPLAAVRELLPPRLAIVGFLARGDDTDISLWRPYGSRRVEHLLVSDPPAYITQQGIEYIVAGEINFELSGTTFAAWQKQTGAELIATTNATLRVSEGPQQWYILRMQNKGSPDSRPGE